MDYWPLILITALAMSIGWFYYRAWRAQKRTRTCILLAICGVLMFFFIFGVIGFLMQNTFRHWFVVQLNRYGDPTVALVHYAFAFAVTVLVGLTIRSKKTGSLNSQNHQNK